MLTIRQAATLERMREDNQASAAPFKAAGHWELASDEFDGWFEEVGVGIVEDQPYNSHYASHTPGHPAYYVFACKLLYESLLRRDRWGVVSRVQSALPEGSPRRVVLGGRPLSWDTLISLDSLLSIAEVSSGILTEPCSVGDLGAGWGRIGFTLKQINPGCDYLIFDLPESLLISSTYLTKIMPTEPFHYYGQPYARGSGGTWFMGAQALGDMPPGRLDYLVSVASFQEMTREYVDAYFDVADRAAHFFYTLQIAGRYYPFKSKWQELLSREVSWSARYFEAVYKVGE